MKSLERVLFLSILAVALFAPACQSVSVPEWPYVREAQEAGASNDGAASDASMGTPLACDGALCDTTNYTACSAAANPAEIRAVRPISLLLVVAGIALARTRTRRKMQGTR